MIQAKGHVHAELMQQYAQDAAETAQPWLQWEYNTGAGCPWFTLHQHPTWSEQVNYRRKPVPNKIEINGEKFEAAAEKPKKGCSYWTILHLISLGFVAESFVWENDCSDKKLFESGNVFNTEKQAQAVADKLNQVFKNRVA